MQRALLFLITFLPFVPGHGFMDLSSLSRSLTGWYRAVIYVISPYHLSYLYTAFWASFIDLFFIFFWTRAFLLTERVSLGKGLVRQAYLFGGSGLDNTYLRYHHTAPADCRDVLGKPTLKWLLELLLSTCTFYHPSKLGVVPGSPQPGAYFRWESSNEVSPL
jgi:hypothetical protein